MLTELRIANFAIIDELSVSFDEGLNVITGETGAGKSIIVEAVGLLLGDRASTDVIRSAEETAQVEAVFKLDGRAPLRSMLTQMGFDPVDELCIRRVISRSGRNRAYINDTYVTLGTLSAIAENLVNICGQHEHQAILNSANHIDILDEYGGLLVQRDEYRDNFLSYRALLARMDQLRQLKARAQERDDYLRFQLRELEAADVKLGEDVSLFEERVRLSQTQKLEQLAGSAYECLYDRERSLIEEFGGVKAAITEINKIDPGFGLPSEHCDNFYYQLEELARTLRDYMAKLIHDPQRLAAVDDRLELLGRLKKKYGGSIPHILNQRAEITRQIAEISSLDEETRLLEKEIVATREQLKKKADALSLLRGERSKLLQQAVETEIRSLNMPKAGFLVAVTQRLAGEEQESWNEKGCDEVEFYLRANLGEDAKPLNRIASGGELSRIILAMKKALAAVARVGTIVFDEVDSGIGGGTAQAVGKKLREAAEHQQVLCITHLPQIACFGQRHYRVEKKIDNGRTIALVEFLSEDQRVDEMARMLGGVNITEKTLAHAWEMLQTARQMA